MEVSPFTRAGVVRDGGLTRYPLHKHVRCMIELLPLTQTDVHDGGLTRAGVVHGGGLPRYPFPKQVWWRSHPLPEQVWCMMEVSPFTRAGVVHDGGLPLYPSRCGA